MIVNNNHYYYFFYLIITQLPYSPMSSLPVKTHTELEALARAVRRGEQPGSPALLWRYLQMNNERAYRQPEASRRGVHYQAFETLLETICDSAVSRHWRCLCLDHIYRPLFAIQRLSKEPGQQRQVRQLYRELSTLSRYFL